MSEMSMADVLALQGRNDNMGGSSWLWWVLLIFLLGGSGFGGYGMNGYGFQQGITNDFLFSNLNSGIEQTRGSVINTQNGIASATYDLNNSIGNLRYDNAMGQNNILQGINTLGMNMQNCCCQTQNAINSGFASLQNTMQMNTMQVMKNECDNTQRIIDLINQNTTQCLRDRLAEANAWRSNAEQSAYLISQLKTTT